MATQQQIELKPCPFCGGEASIRDGGPACKFVQCDICNATSDDGSSELASRKWNTRAALTAAEPVVEPVKADFFLSMTGNTITIEFEDRDDAEAAFDLIESALHAAPQEAL